MPGDGPAFPFGDLSALVSPGGIAIIGASNDPARIGGRPIRYSLEAGFAGPLLPVNPRRKTVQGLAAHPTVEAIPEPFDLAVIALPASEVTGALSAVARKGARAAIVLSSGFNEVGAEGAAREADLIRIARAAGMRLLGPNTLGLYDAASGAAPTFSSLLEGGVPPKGPLAIVSQSGAYGGHLAMLARERGIGLAALLTTGNEADVTIADCIAHCARDPAVGLIGCFAEGIRDGRAFLAALAEARRAGKPVVVMKVGRSTAGEAAARSHTASLAGDDRVFAAAMARAGVIRAGTTEAFVDTLYVLARAGSLAGEGLGILTMSGGAGVLMADAAEASGLAVPPLPAPVQAAFRERNPYGSAANPVDVTGQAINEMGLLTDGLRALFADRGIAAVAAFLMSWPASPALGPALRAAMVESLGAAAGRPVAVAMNAPPSVFADFDAAGLLAFADPTRMIAALAATRALAPPALPDPSGGAVPDLSGVPDRPDEAEAADLLEAAGVAMVRRATARTAGEAAAAAGRLGFPVALKILSADLPHKSEAGGVRLGLGDPDAVRAAAGEMLRTVGRARPDARLSGFLVAPMVEGVAELIVGTRQDATFGPVVMVGLGGVFAEVFQDVAIDLAPVDAVRARGLLQRLAAFPLLDGARGRPKADIEAAAASIAALSRLAAGSGARFAGIEVNPLLVLPAGEGAVGLDAAIAPLAPRPVDPAS